MLGENILVAPVVVKNKQSRLVKLPKGKWKLPSGKVVRGGKIRSFDVAFDELLHFEKQ